MVKVPPFYKNPDGNSCMAACIRMGAEFFTGVAPELGEIDRLTRRRKGEGTWPHGTYQALRGLGLEIEAYEPAMDYGAFAVEPVDYMKQTYADKPEFLRWLLVTHDLNAAAADVRELLGDKLIVRRDVPDMVMVRNYLERGWLVIPNVDINALQDVDAGPEGHAVLVFGADDKSVRLHDPDSEADVNVPLAKFEEAWDYMGAGRREMVAFRK